MKMKTEEDSEPGRKRRGFLEQEHGEPAGLKINRRNRSRSNSFPVLSPHNRQRKANDIKQMTGETKNGHERQKDIY